MRPFALLGITTLTSHVLCSHLETDDHTATIDIIEPTLQSEFTGFGNKTDTMADHTDMNRAHFDEHAKTYNSRFQKTIEQLIAEIQKRKDWIGVDWVEDSDQEHSSSASPQKTVRLLDYACGTGLVTRALLPYITTSIGIDLSPNMVAEFNTLASNQGLSPTEMHAYVGNLLSTSSTANAETNLEDEKFCDFDLAVVGLGFHHFDNPKDATKQLAKRLKKGGALMIIDFLPHAANDMSHSHDHSHSHGHGAGHGHSHSHSHHHDKETADVVDEKEAASAQHTVSHHGFDIADVKTMFEDAGVGKGFEAIELGDGVVFARQDGEETRRDFKRSVFMARGFKE